MKKIVGNITQKIYTEKFIKSIEYKNINII